MEIQGGYLTKSDALDESSFLQENIRIVKRDSEECEELWKSSCRMFVEKLQMQYPKLQIVLIKNYLSEKVGDIHFQKAFEEFEQIQSMNRILSGYYQFFTSICPEAKVIEASECKYYFTDRQYEYGAIPSHLNEIANEEIAKRIEEAIGL